MLLSDEIPIRVPVILPVIKPINPPALLMNKVKTCAGNQRVIATVDEERPAGFIGNLGAKYHARGVVLVFRPLDIPDDGFFIVGENGLELCTSQTHRMVGSLSSQTGGP